MAVSGRRKYDPGKKGSKRKASTGEPSTSGKRKTDSPEKEDDTPTPEGATAPMPENGDSDGD